MAEILFSEVNEIGTWETVRQAGVGIREVKWILVIFGEAMAIVLQVAIQCCHFIEEAIEWRRYYLVRLTK